MVSFDAASSWNKGKDCCLFVPIRIAAQLRKLRGKHSHSDSDIIIGADVSSNGDKQTGSKPRKNLRSKIIQESVASSDNKNAVKRCFLSALSCVSVTFRHFGSILVPAVFIMMIYTAYCMLFVYLPALYGPFLYLLQAIISVWTFVTTMHFFLSTVLTSPGSPGVLSLQQLTQGDNLSRIKEVAEREDSPDLDSSISMYGYCHACEMPRPARTHHCKICGQCRMRMDHHCPWVNNCVGLNNQRSFLLFVGWITFGGVYAGLTGVYLVFYKPHLLRRTYDNSYLSMLNSGAHGFCVAILIMCVSASCLFFFHVYLACTAQTTLETYKNQAVRRAKNGKSALPSRRHMFDYGWRENLRRYFNTYYRPWYYIFVPMYIPPFESEQDLIDHSKGYLLGHSDRVLDV